MFLAFLLLNSIDHLYHLLWHKNWYFVSKITSHEAFSKVKTGAIWNVPGDKSSKSYYQNPEEMNKNICPSKIPRNLVNFGSMQLLLYQKTLFACLRTRCVCLARDSAWSNYRTDLSLPPWENSEKLSSYVQKCHGIESQG